ncbi:MAG: serine hydrolase [Chloroflexi bacterium]|nr:serine hydrolase [Chloroflexota bacterium]
MRLFAPITLLLVAISALVACGGDPEPSGPTATPFVILGTPDGGSPSADATNATGAPADDPAVTLAPAGELVSLDWLAGSAAFPAVPSPFAAPVADPGLLAAVQVALDGRDGVFSVIVHNLADGRYAAINPNATYYAASLFKAPVLLEAYRQREVGIIDFATELTVDEEVVQYDLGTLAYLGIEEGDTVLLGEAVEAMIVVSDTALANLVLGELGCGNVDSTLAGIGATTMSVSTRDLPTTAADMYAVISAIATGDGVSEGSRREMLSLMAQEWFRDGVVAGIPAGTPFAHKTGSFTDATHDVAVVEGPAGPYIIVVLSDRSSQWGPIASVSDAVWRYFASGSEG